MERGSFRWAQGRGRAVCSLFGALAVIQLAPAADSGSSPPKVIHKVEPEYTRAARLATIQGTVLIQVVIDTTGAPTELSVVSPLGFGLDDRALQAVSQWRFEPAKKDGESVQATTIVPVDFRLFHRWFDPKPEEHRTSFNLAVAAIQEQRRDSQTLDIIKDLAHQKYPPAMYLYAKLLESGDGFPQDRELALRLTVEAANQNYPAAMYDTGRMMMEGRQLPIDTEKGLELMRNAAVLGQKRAQFHLGVAFETGDGVPQSLDDARRYFRLCAIAGEPPCQVKLAKLLLERPDRQERDYIQAIAWLQLAADRGSMHARMMLQEQHPELTPKQLSWIDKLKTQLVRTR